MAVHEPLSTWNRLGILLTLDTIAAIAIVLVLLIVIVMFTGVGGEHGPWRHMGHKVSAALGATYRPVTLLATDRPVVLAATYRPRQSPSGHVSSRTR